jgi:hypothetical protein
MKLSTTGLAIAKGLFSCGADAFTGSHAKARFAVVSPTWIGSIVVSQICRCSYGFTY